MPFILSGLCAIAMLQNKQLLVDSLFQQRCQPKHPTILAPAQRCATHLSPLGQLPHWWNIWVPPPGAVQSALGLSTVETFLCPLVVGNVGTAPTIRTTRHELPLICAIFFQPNEVLWEDKNEVLVLRFRHLYNIILILHCQWGQKNFSCISNGLG